MKKGVKKVSAILKNVVLYSPMAFTLLGVAAGLYGEIAGNVKVNNYKESLFENEKVIVQQAEDIDIYKDKLDLGEITTEEFREKMGYVESIQYIDDILKFSEFEEEKAVLKDIENIYTKTSRYGMIAAAGGLCVASVFYATPIGLNIIESAEKDWNYSDEESCEEKQ